MKFWLLCVYFSFVCQLNAQLPFSFQVNYKQGLPSHEVYNIGQDHFQNLWVGCAAGMYRYNGSTFSLVESTYQNGGISSIQFTANNQIWCQNFSGQLFRNSIFSNRLELFFDAARFSSKYPSYIAINDQQAYIAGDSVLLFVHNGIIKRRWNLSDLHLNTHLASVSKIDAEHIGVCDLSGNLRVINRTTHQVKTINSKNQKGDVFKLFTTQYNSYYVVENNKKKALTYSIYKLTKNGIEPVILDKSFNNSRLYSIHANVNNLYFCTGDGVYYLNRKTWKFQNNRLFAGHKISSLFENTTGEVFYSDLQHGIFIIPNQDVQVFNTSNSRLTDNSITHLSSLNNQLCIGLSNGNLWTLSSAGNQLNNTVVENGVGRDLKKIVSTEHYLYLARGRFEQWDLKEQRIRTFNELQNVNDFLVSNNKIYYITSNRVGVKDLTNHSHVVLRSKGGKSIVRFQDNLYALFSDGLFVFENNTWRSVRLGKKTLYGNAMQVINDELFIATKNLGLCRFNGKKWQFDFLSAFTGSHEVLNFTCSNDSLVLATRGNIVLYHLKEKWHQKIENSGGLILPEVTQLKLLNGFLYVGTIDGLFQFKLQQQKIRTKKTSIRLIACYINGKKSEISQRLHLNGQEKNVRFVLESPHVPEQGHFYFRYRLKELDSHWDTISGIQNEIRFNQIPNGTYTLQVQTVESNGTLGNLFEQKISVDIPYWRSWWFLLLILSSGLLIVGLIFNVWFKRYKRSNQIKQDAITFQLTALKAQLNPHFMFNTLNSLQDLILQEDFENTNYYLSKFASLMRDILKTSGENTIPLSVELKLLNSYLELERLRFGEDFQFDVTTDSSLLREEIVIPPLLIQPYVENAIKHGLLHKKGSKQLSIQFKNHTDFFECMIQDNGIGRNRSHEINQRQKHTSFANQANEKRIELMRTYFKKKFEVKITDLEDNQQAIGTSVSIIISK